MALTLPYDITLDGGVNATHVQADLQAIANKFGSIDQNDLSGSIVLPSGKLSAQNVELEVDLEWGVGASAGVAIPSASTTVPLHFRRFPGTALYTIQNVSFAYTCVTAGTAGSVSLVIGNITANVWTTVSTVVVSTPLATVTSGQSAYGEYALSTTSFTAPNAIALLPTANGTALYRYTATLRLTRSLQ